MSRELYNPLRGLLFSGYCHKRLTESLIIERDRWKIKTHKFSIPDCRCRPMVLRCREVIFIEQRADEFGRRIRERVVTQKAQYRLISLQKLAHKAYKPRLFSVRHSHAFRCDCCAKRQKPH